MLAVTLGSSLVIALSRRRGFRRLQSLLTFRVWVGSVLILVAAILAWVFFVPADTGRFVSPDGAWMLALSAYPDLCDFEGVVLRATLTARHGGRAVGRARLAIPKIRLNGGLPQPNHGLVDWDLVWVVWEDNNRSALLVLPELNVAVRLPSGETLFPIPNAVQRALGATRERR